MSSRGKRGMTSKEYRAFLIIRDIAYEMQNRKCYWCSCEMNLIENDPQQLTGDHVIPLREGTELTVENIVAACRTCNNKRNDDMQRDPNRPLRRLTVGDETHRSPFEVLKKL